MKKTLLFIALLIASVSLKAQLSGGIKGGLNISQIRAESSGDTETSDMALGFQFGGYLNYPLSEKVIFQPELVFSRTGGKESEYDPDLQENIDLTLKLDYISIPLLLKFKTGESLYFLAGPQAGILAQAKAKVELMGQSVTVDIKEGFESLDFGLTGGIGFSMDKICVDARYNFGLVNIAKDSGGDKVQNRVIMICISYKVFEK